MDYEILNGILNVPLFPPLYFHYFVTNHARVHIR